jgi:mannose-1-phosphate guanylyltransferase
LWPLSRAARPKFLLDLTGSGRSLLEQTWDRLAPLSSPERVVVVTGQSHVEAVRAQLDGLAAGNLLAEPAPRDSAAAIGLAAAVIAARDPDAVLGSFAADHVIRNQAQFEEAVRQAVVTARSGSGYLVTIGIEPDRPSTAFGYIQLGRNLAVPDAADACEVASFVEKPNALTAQRYLEDGGYRWNAGMFVCPAKLLLELLAQERPALYAGLTKIAQAWDLPERDTVLAQVWPDLEKVAIDYAVAEPAAAAGRVAVIPADLGWDDVGDFAALAALLPGTDDGVSVLGGQTHVFDLDSSGLAVAGGDRLIAVLGLEDIVVVDTPDALLVTTRERAQEVKAVVDRLRAAGRGGLL